jgi:hypothetical protein
VASTALAVRTPLKPVAVAGYATSLETAPQTTLATTGVVVGAFWGGLVAYLGARIGSSKHPLGWALAGAGAGAALLGAAGNQQGEELATWLRQY